MAFPVVGTIGNVGNEQLIIEKAKGFAKKTFTIIFVASIVIWFLQTFDIRLNVAGSAEESLLAMLGGLAAPIFAPLGFGDWRISTALITGFTAKENVVSTLTVLLGGNVSSLETLFTPFTAVVLLVFTLLYAMRGGGCNGKAGNGRCKGGDYNGACSVCNRIDSCFSCPWYRNDFRFSVKGDC